MMPLFGLASPQAPLDGQGAADAARRFLVRMGVRDLGDIEHLGPGWADRMGQKAHNYSVAFALPNRAFYTVQITDRGRVTYAMRSDAPHGSGSRDVARQRRFLGSLMARVPNAPPTRPDRPATSLYASHEYDVLKNGLVLFNRNPTYGYSLSADEGGALTSFGAPVALPPVASPKPKLDAKAAKAKLIALWGKREHERAFSLHIVPQLGYYLVKGETTARLVWQGMIVPDANPIFDAQWPIDGFIDARTGETLRRNEGE